jgi:UDP-2,3-diacylglucosamine pyrophosphatase LpxH
MQGNCFDTVIISDLHLGSEVSQAGAALAFLQSVRFKRLILLGDIFADLNFRRLTKEHWKFLSHLVGIPVYQEFAWNYGGKRHLAIHGHQFDSFAVANAFLSKVGQFIFLQLQKIDSKNQRFVRYLDRLNTRWLRLSEQVAHGALSYAKPGKAERIFCGHTHAALSRKRDGVEYYNSGGWVDQRCTYIAIGPEGIAIHEYVSEFNNRDSSQERITAFTDTPGVSVPSGLWADEVYEGVPG